MDELEIVKKFLKGGFQLDKDTLEFFKESPQTVEEFLQYLRDGEKTIFVTKKHLQNFLSRSRLEINPIFEFKKTEKTYAVEDFLRVVQDRYDKVHGMLTNRIDLPSLISVNKISDRTMRFSIVGIVADIDETVTIEDRTGKITLPFAKDTAEREILSEGDVAGFFCESSDRGTEIKKIVLPDMPIKKEIAKTSQDVQCVFSKQEREEAGGVFTFVLSENKISASLKDKKFVFSDPCIVDVGGVKIFLSGGKHFERFRKNANESAAKVMLNLARKRRLPVGAEEIFLEETPDIFVVDHFGDAEEINYKGASFLSLGSGGVAWKVNLRTRENVKIHFN